MPVICPGHYSRDLGYKNNLVQKNAGVPNNKRLKIFQTLSIT